MGPFAREEEAKEIAEVNVVPLADVSLVLLIILLLLSGQMAQRMLHVRAAARPTGPAIPTPEELMGAPRLPEMVLAVALDPQGFSAGGKPFASTRELTAYLQNEFSRRLDRKVFLSPHPDVLHGRVVDAIELIKASGAETVALVQAQEETGGGLPPFAPR